jgi:hypothetical protein
MEKTQTERPKQPVKKFRAGGITATLWENKGEFKGQENTFVSVVLRRSYKDKENQWQESDSFRKNDLPKAILVLNKAFEYIAMKEEDKD